MNVINTPAGSLASQAIIYDTEQFNELCPPSWAEKIRHICDGDITLTKMVLNLPSLLMLPVSMVYSLISGKTKDEIACQNLREGVSVASVDVFGRNHLFQSIVNNEPRLTEIYATSSMIHFRLPASVRSVLHELAIDPSFVGALNYLTNANKLKIDSQDIRGMTPMHVAILANNAPALKVFLNAKVDINKVDAHGRSAVMLAAQWCPECFKILVDHGADLNIKDNDGLTVWHYAALSSKPAEVMAKLIEKNISPHQLDNLGRTPIHIAAYLSKPNDAIGLLIKYGVKAHEFDFNNNTALHIASFCGHLNVVNELISHEVDLNVKDKNGRTPLHLAAREGKLEVLQALCATGKVEVNILDKFGRTPLFESILSDRVEIVSELLSNKADPNICSQTGQSPRYVAVKKGNDQIASLLNVAGGKIIVKGSASLQENGAYDRDLPLHVAIASKNYAEIQKSLLNGVSLDGKDSDGYTPLILALMTKQESVIMSLLDAGCSVTESDNSIITPLHYAAQLEDPQILQMILRRGGSVFAEDIYGRIPLHFAASAGTDLVIQKLLSDPKTCDRQINYGNRQQVTPLQEAISKQHVSTVSLLLKHGAVPMTLDVQKCSSFHYAARVGNLDILNLLFTDNPSKELALLAINLTDIEGRTPLYYAIAHGHKEVEKSLVEQGAVLYKQGFIELQHAIHKRDADVVIKMLDDSSPAINSQLQGASQWQFSDIFKLCDDDNFVNSLLKNPRLESRMQSLQLPHQRTLLHVAVIENRLETIKQLIDQGAKLDAQDGLGLTPMHYAAKMGNTEALELLAIAGANLIAPNRNGKTPLGLALLSGHKKIIASLINMGVVETLNTDPKKSSIALLNLIELGNVEKVKEFIDKGANIALVDAQGMGGMHYAARINNENSDSTNMINLLIQSGLKADKVEILKA